jgi:hypothetical protein
MNSLINGCEVLMVVTEEYGLLAYDGMQLGGSLAFERNVSLQSAWLKSKPKRNQQEQTELAERHSVFWNIKLCSKYMVL